MAAKSTVLLFILGLLTVLWANTALAAGPGSIAPEPAADNKEAPKRFAFSDVVRRAEELAAAPYAEPADPLPDALRNLGYDQYRDIRFRPDQSLWRDEGLPFQVQFFARGFLFSKKVAVNVITDGDVKPVPYTNAMFEFKHNVLPENPPADLGFAGLRLLYPLQRDNYYDEVVVFLGASYFRAIGRNQGYGLSARGLAIDTGLPKPEEFPAFREFWLVKPDRDATEITLYALLDSPSVTGAYRFLIKPGRATMLEVKSQLFLRKAVERLGIAPLTSMFFYGENTEVRVDDFRPEVHDSDGLLLATGNGEWIWRPLTNPVRLSISSFLDTNPRGFGLRQRDRDFNNYQDLEARYEIRPSIWVEPIGDWGKGAVQVVEIPSQAEFYDDIVAFWVPEAPPQAGQPLELNYRLYFELDDLGRPPAGKTLATRIGAGGTVDDIGSKARHFVLDFGGKPLEDLGPGTPVTAVVTSSSGKIINLSVHKNDFTNGWRVSFELIPEDRNPVELRCFLKLNNNVLTETWSYQWEPR